MAATLALALLTFTLGVTFGPRWLRFLQAHQMGKQLNPSEPEEHAHKEGTPTMGGVVFMAPIFAVGLTFQVLFGGQLMALLPLTLAAGCALLGAIDDLQTLVSKARSEGLSPRAKWAVEIVLSLASGGALAWAGYNTIHIPFAGALTVPPWLYVPAATFLLLCTINGVGITDGMDSLVGTTAGIAFSAFWIIAWHAGEPISATLCGITVGGLLAYLWFNAHPAQMFMGDTGSLALGSLLGMVALMERQPLLLLPIGVIYVANVLSDILQVLSVRLRGKRLFHIAPMHHHFRRMGWPETWVVQRFWITGAVGAVIGLLLAFAGGS